MYVSLTSSHSQDLSTVLSLLSCLTILAFLHLRRFSYFRNSRAARERVCADGKWIQTKFFSSFRNVKRVHIFIYLALQHFLCLLAMKSSITFSSSREEKLHAIIVSQAFKLEGWKFLDWHYESREFKRKFISSTWKGEKAHFLQTYWSF